ncbi:MAG: sigma factor, partial [Candidatus Brocadiia bacterium]|nr:sigma factor [Candidatus Brocadiia bacterium]
MGPTQRLLDRLLILRYQTGDVAALEELVDRYYAPLRYFVRRLLGGAECADDIFQEVWLTVFRNLRRLRSPEAFSVWLYRIARHKV